MKKYRTEMTRELEIYMSALMNRLVMVLKDEFNLAYKYSYVMSYDNSLNTASFYIYKVNPKSMTELVKRSQVLRVAMNAGNANESNILYAGDAMMLTVEKPQRFREKLDLQTMERQRLVGRGCVTTLGIKSNNATADIDVSQPGQAHSLFCGSTGSGKSLLQQLELFNLVANHQPTRLRTLYIDVGKSFGDWSRNWWALPHNGTSAPIRYGDLPGALKVLSWVRDEIANRLQMKSVHGAEWLNSQPRILLVIDEAKTLIELSADGKNNVALDLLGQILREGRSAAVNVSMATQDSTIESLSRDIKTNCGIKICGMVNSKTTLRTAIGGDNELPSIPKSPGEFAMSQDGRLSFFVAPMFKGNYLSHYVGESLPPIVDIESIDAESIAQSARSECPIHSDWEGLSDKPAKEIFAVLRRDYARGKVTTKAIKDINWTSATEAAQELRDKMNNLRDAEAEAISEILAENGTLYNPFPNNYR